MSSSHARPLSTATLALVDAAQRPAYDRSQQPRIVHLGLGAFARAHLGVYADDLLRRGRPAMIRGVSIRSGRVAEQLSAQDGLYTVAEREPDAETSLRIIGAVASVETGPVRAIDAMAERATKLVTLTITEKGYDSTPEDSGPSPAPASVPALIARALARRRDSGLAPPIFVSLDNLLDNGRVLRSRVLDAAGRIDPTLADWIADEVAFPSSVVDRMVPAPTGLDVEYAASRLGLVDRAAVSTEAHRSWIIGVEDPLAPLAEVGVELVPDVSPYERRKLWLLNGPHSAVAYGGLLAGCDTISGTVANKTVAPFVRRLVDETLEVAELPVSLGPVRFASEALRRFANPALRHACTQVGADGSSKLPQRLLPVVAARRRRALDTHRFAVVAAIWIAATAGLRVRGADLPTLEDPLAGDLRAAASRGAPLLHLSALAFAGHSDPAFVPEVAHALRLLTDTGLSVLEVPN